MKDVTSAYGSSSTHSISNDPSQDDYCQVGKGISLASSRGLLDVVERMERVRGRVALFDPSTARRTFRIRMTDISEMVLLPSLLNRLRKEAPEVVIEAVKVSVDSQRQPRVGERLTRRAFGAEGHIVVSSSGTGHAIVDQVLHKEGLKRRAATTRPDRRNGGPCPRNRAVHASAAGGTNTDGTSGIPKSY
jgi:hypothetical protein